MNTASSLHRASGGASPETKRSTTSTPTSTTTGCPTCASYPSASTPSSITPRFAGSAKRCAACGLSCGKPALLDLFSGAGGAARGYQLAGFCVLGVDNRPQPHYVGCQFHQADALTFPLDGFDAIHASPPCQGYSWSTRKGREDRWPLLISDVRRELDATGLPWVIENVPNARRDMREPVLLCGTMFGLGVIKHRLFESTVDLWPQPGHPRCQGAIASGAAVTVAGHGGDSKDFRLSRWREAMGIDWMRDRHDLAEAIPPAYTEHIGRQLLAAIEASAAA